MRIKMKTIILFLFLLFSLVSVNSQTFENPFEIENSNFTFYDMAVKGDQVLVIGSYGNTPEVISIFQYKESRWEEISNVVFENGINRRLATKSKSNRDPQNNPKIYIDDNSNIWVTGSAVYHRKNGIWHSYKPPVKSVNFDSLFSHQFHELYFMIDNTPVVSSLVSTRGTILVPPRNNLFEIFTLEKDTLRHTSFDKKIPNVKTSTAYFVDESKMIVIGDTLVVYRPNGTIFFVNPDSTIDSVEFPRNRGLKSSNLEIRQIFPIEDSKLVILTDLSTNSIPNSPVCCSGVYVLENRKKWIVIDDNSGLPLNFSYQHYSGRTMLKAPNGELILSLYPNNTIGFFSQLYTISSDYKIKHISLENKMNNAIIFPRRNYFNGLSKDDFNKIIEAIRTNDNFLKVPKSEIVKIRIDLLGNLWCMFEDFILNIPAFIPTSVVEETHTNTPFLVIPNPSKQTISLKSNSITFDKVEIVSVHGQILQTVFSDFSFINIQSLPCGVYLLKIHTKSGIQTTTFIKEF